MSNTICHSICEICQKANGIYTCPRCNRKYCSSACYKSKKHDLCSESFYREWVESSLHEKTFDDADKKKMIDILKKHNETLDAEEEMSLADRFAGVNLEASEEILWENLNEGEQAEFMDLIKDEKNIQKLVQPFVEQPWWCVKKIERVLDLEVLDKEVKTSICPPHPMDVRNLSTITVKKPSECIKFNLVNILYTYSFIYRFYNGELRDFLEDVIDSVFQFSPVLTGEQNYFSLEEALQDSIRLIVTSDLNVPLDFVKSISNDVCCFLEGPENAPSTYFIMCALHDMKLMLFELKYELSTKKNVNLKKKVMPIIKKLDYFMSWCLDFSHVFPELTSKIMLMMAPDFITDHPNTKPSETNQVYKNVPVIEEIED